MDSPWNPNTWNFLGNSHEANRYAAANCPNLSTSNRVSNQFIILPFNPPFLHWFSIFLYQLVVQYVCEGTICMWSHWIGSFHPWGGGKHRIVWDRALALGAAVGNRFLHLCRCNETYPRFGLKKKLVKPLIHILYMQTDSKFLITLRFEAGLSVINGSLNNCHWGKKAAALTCLLSWFWLMNHCVQVWFICHFSKWPLKIAENHKERKMVFMQLYSVQKVSFLFPTWKESGIRISHCTEPLVQ